MAPRPQNLSVDDPSDISDSDESQQSTTHPKRSASEAFEHDNSSVPQKKRNYVRKTKEQKEQEALKVKRKYTHRTEAEKTRVKRPYNRRPKDGSQQEGIQSKKPRIDRGLTQTASRYQKSMAPCFCGEERVMEDFISCHGEDCPKADMWIHLGCAGVTVEQAEYRQKMMLHWFCEDCVEIRAERARQMYASAS